MYKKNHHNFIRSILSLICRYRETVINDFGSIISPFERSVVNSKTLESRFKEFITLVKPRAQIKSEYLRLGSSNDGGYVVTKSVLKKIDYLVSGGIENNNDFEFAVAKLGIKGLQIDNSIDHPPKSHPNLGFKKFTLGIKSNDINSFFPKYSNSILLKLDIEGSEYKTLEQIKSFKNISCLIIEFHNLNKIVTEDFWFNFKKLFSKLKNKYEIVFTNCNNAGGVFVMGNNLAPKVIEITFIKKNLSKPSKSNDMSFLKSINRDYLPEISLNFGKS